MEKNYKSNFYFDNYIIKEMNYYLNTEFEQDSNSEIELDLSFNIETSTSSDDNSGYTEIELKVFEEAEENDYPFCLKTSIVGYFSADDDMKHKDFENMCKYNGVSILFPFLRSAITDITKSANISPLILPLINVKNLVEDEK